IYLFSKEFTALIIIAFVVAVPVAYYMMSNWLNNFAFRINITIWVFVLAIVLSVVIAWITVGYKSIKAAVANPVKSLRTECVDLIPTEVYNPDHLASGCRCNSLRTD